jgi:hypothetical protein
MSTTIDVICYKVRPLKNNESPLMIRISKDRKRKYKSIGLSIKEEDWDFSKSQPKPNVHNRELILKVMDDKLAEYRDTVLEYRAEGRDFTASSLVEGIKNPQALASQCSFFYVFYEIIHDSPYLYFLIIIMLGSMH